jgi:opacity protein-like surface antigen
MKLNPHFLFVVIMASAFYSIAAKADDLIVSIVEPYVDFRTGPASEYPIFHVAEQGETITIFKKKTGWYKAITYTGQEGWISAEQLGKTIKPGGELLYVPTGSFEDYTNRTFEFSAFGGILESVTAMSVAAAWNVTGNLVAEATYHIFPEWKVSPYLTIGAGGINTRPRSNLVQSGDEVRKSDFYEVGAGIRYYFARNMVIKFEYRNIIALTDRDDQEQIEEFKLGFSVFF